MLNNEIINRAISNRRYLHSNPELSFEEYKTSAFIQEKLNELGIVNYRLTDTGVIGVIGEGDKSIALRADIDALPIVEENDIEFKSLNNGIMHACGHDLHTASLLGVAEILKSKESELRGKVYLIFQQAEEKLPGGAKTLLEVGLFKDDLPKYIFGWHILPQEIVGNVCVAGGYVMAATDEIYVDIIGKGAHAAQPHLANDPILTASELVIALQSVISKNKNPLQPGVLTIASFNGGNTTNVIPEFVELKGTLRTYQPEFRELALKRIKEIVEHVCKANQCAYKLKIVNGYPSLYNDDRAVKIVKETCLELYGDSKLIDFEPKMWAEDFAYYAEKIPACFFFLGVKPNDMTTEMPALHNPKLNPSEETLQTAIEMMSECALRALREL